MTKLVISSETFPDGLDERTRFKLWQDDMVNCIGSNDWACLADRPFAARWEVTQFQSAMVGRFNGTVNKFVRTQQQAAVSPNDAYEFSFNTAPTPFVCAQRGQEQVLAREQATFLSSFDAVSVRSNAPTEFLGVMVSRQAIRDLVPMADDLVQAPLDSTSPAFQFLRRYLGMLCQPPDLSGDPDLAQHVETTLVDLVALALGAHGDASTIARMRGLRAAHVKAILQEIRAGFANPSFSVTAVAQKLTLSPRYLQNLLQETGVSFTERVLELRLQKARTMLAGRPNDRLKVSDIALMCGFNEISHFNRCFRRRFGASPTEYRQ